MSYYNFSPDGGRFIHTNGKFYFEDGEILSETATIRSMPSTKFEDYSKWSDSKRKEVKKQIAKERKERKKKADEINRKTLAFVKKAKTKLTEEEFNSVVDWNEYYENIS